MDDNGEFDLLNETKGIRTKVVSQASRQTELILVPTTKPYGNEEKLNDNNKMDIDESVQEQNTILKKREILRLADQGSKRKAILMTTAFILVLLGYFAGCIVITEIIFNSYDSLLFYIRWVSMRHSAMTLNFVMLRELVITGDEELKAKTDNELNNLYNYEQKINQLKVETSTIYHNYKSLVIKLDSEAFCDTIKDDLVDELIEQCYEKGDYSMERGMQNNIFQILSYLNSIENRYRQFGSTIPYQEILNISGWPIACNFFIILRLCKDSFS